MIAAHPRTWPSFKARSVVTLPSLRLCNHAAMTLGAVMSALCAAMLMLGFEATQVLTMFLRTTGAAVLNVTLALYIMDNIHKQQLVRSEPLRFAVAL